MTRRPAPPSPAPAPAPRKPATTVPADAPDYLEQPRGIRSYDLGLLAGIGVAIAYGLAAELLALTFGLVAVGFIGGIVIGGAVSRGAWAGHPHPPNRRIQAMSALIAIGSWIVGVFIAYVVSQMFIPQASTTLLERISFGGFSDYFTGLFDQIRFIHAASLAAMAFMAWRGAR